MWRRRLATAGVSFLGLVTLAALGLQFLRTTPRQTVEARAESRLPELRRMVEQQENESAEAVASYAPKTLPGWTT
jgi:hypothetical protein